MLPANHVSSAESRLTRELAEDGFSLLAPHDLQPEVGVSAAELDLWKPTWERLPRDTYLRDGGHYRSRRHACLIQSFEPGAEPLSMTPPRAHFQPTTYNALHGGLERWFEPIEAALVRSSAWERLLCGLGHRFAQLHPTPRWHIEAHQFRIDTAEGIGRPTPEGAHRDGVDYVAVILVQRRAVRGGETHVFPLQGERGLRFTMLEPWTALVLDDARCMHETTPIQPDGAAGVRDTLVLTYRAQGFQAP